MKKIKVSEATPLQLNWMVSQAESVAVVIRRWTGDGKKFLCNTPGQFSDEAVWCPSEDWAQGGPIIEREYIDVEVTPMGAVTPERVEGWRAWKHNDEADATVVCGPTPLIAAMRCFVVSKLGDEVDVPEELA